MEDHQEIPSVRGTFEWATHTANLQVGCEHDCRYCYAKTAAIGRGACTAEGWARPVPDPGARARAFPKVTGRVMFPSAHDITPLNLDPCARMLQAMAAPGNQVLVVSKPRVECIRELCRTLRPARERVVFRFTIGSADDAVLSRWEPHAPSFAERLACLHLAHGEGFATSVSSEPMLDRRVERVVEAVSPFITDTLWLGLPNKLLLRVSTNCPGDPAASLMASELAALWDEAAIRDLYRRFSADPRIRWKDSLKQALGLPRPREPGLDV